MGIDGVDTNDADEIIGGTDQTRIGNVGDRLKVDSVFNQSSIPSDSVVYTFKELDSAGSTDLSVNGSVTPVVFTAGPGAGETWYVFEYGLVIEDSGANKFNDFGAIAGGLSTGVLVEQVISSVSYSFVNLKTNTDIVTTFSDHFVRGQATAFINSANFFAGKVELRVPVTLIGDDGDVIKFTVRDDLTGVNLLNANIEYMVAI